MNPRYLMLAVSIFICAEPSSGSNSSLLLQNWSQSRMVSYVDPGLPVLDEHGPGGASYPQGGSQPLCNMFGCDCSPPPGARCCLGYRFDGEKCRKLATVNRLLL